MSESMFLWKSTSRFLAAHPREEGWRVYEFGSDTARKMYLNYVLDCLRDWHPDALKRRTALSIVEEDALRKSFEKYKTSAEDIVKDFPDEVDSFGWRGSVELVWNRQDIHCWTFSLLDGCGYSDVCLVATKSLTAFHDFLLVLTRYGQIRHKEVKEILVVNGENIPIAVSSWDDIALPPDMARDIRTNVQGFFQSSERYQQLGIPHRRGFVFAGPPGCGKTLMLKTLAYNTPAKFISVLGKADVKDDIIGYALYLAETYTPAVVLLEDLDQIVEAEGISLSHLLNQLDGLRVLNGVLLIATCNEPDKLDPALIHRPSRFDRVWRFELPKYEQRLALLHKRGGAFFSESALQESARRSEGFSMAYVQEIVVSALLECAHDEIVPDDDCLLRSLDTLSVQRKSASKPGESIDGKETVGFFQSNNGDR
ncbi:MAG: ATP-binding protein [Nitrospirota bacterium]